MAGGAEILISSEGITVKTVGYAKFFAAEHIFESSAKEKLSPIPLGSLIEHFSQRVELVNEQNVPLGKGIPYYLYDEKTKQEFYGRTDEKGKTSRVYTEDQSSIIVKVGKKAMDILLEKGIEI